MQLTRLLFALLAVTATTFGAESTSSSKRIVSLEDCIQMALQHNFDVQISRRAPEIARYNLSVSYGGYDPTFSLSGEHDYSLSPGGLDPQGRQFPGTESESDRFSTGIGGLLPWGLSYNVGGSIADRFSTSPGSIPDLSNPIIVTNNIFDINTGNTISFLSTNYNTMPARFPFENTSGNIGFLQLRQPVLKNSWIDSARLNIAIRKRDLKISELTLRSQIMSTVTLVAQAYYNLIFSRENVKVQEKALELADRLLAENKKRVEVGAMAPLDEKQAESQVATSRADLLAARNALAVQENTLKDLLTDDYKNIHDTEMVPAEALTATPETFNLQRSWEKGLNQRPDLLQARLDLEKQGYVVRFQKNQLFPQLDLFGTYGFSASGQEYSGAFDQFRRGDSPFYSAGAQVSIPLGNSAARNTYKAAKATREQTELMVRQLEQRVMVGIDNSLKQAQSSYERVEATLQARIYAEAALDAEQKKLENGKSTSFFVLDFQNRLTAARSAEIRALADYNIALTLLAQSEGATLERHRLSLETK